MGQNPVCFLWSSTVRLALEGQGGVLVAALEDRFAVEEQRRLSLDSSLLVIYRNLRFFCQRLHFGVGRRVCICVMNKVVGPSLREGSYLLEDPQRGVADRNGVDYGAYTDCDDVEKIVDVDCGVYDNVDEIVNVGRDVDCGMVGCGADIDAGGDDVLDQAWISYLDRSVLGKLISIFHIHSRCGAPDRVRFLCCVTHSWEDTQWGKRPGSRGSGVVQKKGWSSALSAVGLLAGFKDKSFLRRSSASGPYLECQC